MGGESNLAAEKYKINSVRLRLTVLEALKLGTYSYRVGILISREQFAFLIEAVLLRLGFLLGTKTPEIRNLTSVP